MKYYVGHPAQTRGAEQYVMKGARAEGMNMLYLRNLLQISISILVKLIPKRLFMLKKLALPI